MQPTIIIEMAKSETLSSLYLNDLTADYFSASHRPILLQVYLEIKIFPHQQDSTTAMCLRFSPNWPPNVPSMIKIANTTPNIAISFGMVPLNYH